jgi:hypothetical protein
MRGLRFELLGPLRALRDGLEIPLGPPKQRAVLAVLLLQEGRPLSYEGWSRPCLRSLHQRILRQDPELLPPPSVQVG